MLLLVDVLALGGTRVSNTQEMSRADIACQTGEFCSMFLDMLPFKNDLETVVNNGVRGVYTHMTVFLRLIQDLVAIPVRYNNQGLEIYIYGDHSLDIASMSKILLCRLSFFP